MFSKRGICRGRVDMRYLIGLKLMSSYHIVAVFLSVFISACTQPSDVLFLDPTNAILSNSSVHQKKTFALDVLFVVESSNNNFSSKNVLTEHIEYLLQTLLYQRRVMDLHVGFTLASAKLDSTGINFKSQQLNQNSKSQDSESQDSENLDPLNLNSGNLDFTELAFIDQDRSEYRVGGFEFFTNENLDEMFPSDVFYVETLQDILETGDVNNQSFFDAVSRVLTSDDTIENEFYREDADLLLVFIGEDDQSDSIDVESLGQKILELKKYQKNRVNVLSIYPIFNKCTSSDDLSVRRVKEFAGTFNGHVLHLCAPIFDKLLQVAQVTYQNVASISLTRIPLLETVALCHGSNMISQDAFQGWLYLPQSNRIALAWDVNLSPPQPLSSSSSKDSVEDEPLNLQTKETIFTCNSNASLTDTSPHLFNLSYLSTSPSKVAKNLLSLQEEQFFSEEE